MKVGIVSGGFDPLHIGHINYINAAKDMVDVLLVFPNSDAWLTRKKGKPFMDQETRVAILSNFKSVNLVIPFSDEDDADGSASAAIYEARRMFPDDEIYFMNGGDRTKENIPEEPSAMQCKVTLLFGVGGENKVNSSSGILNNWNEN